MAKSKTWTAADIKMGVIRMSLDDGGILNSIQGYSFVGGNGSVIKNLPSKTVQVAVPFADLPVSIQTALAEINSYMYQEALKKEGME